MKIKIDKKILDRKVSVWVNSKDWMKFSKNSLEMLGLNPSQSVAFLVKCFNRKGDFAGISHLIVDTLKPVVERELIREIKRVESKPSK